MTKDLRLVCGGYDFSVPLQSKIDRPLQSPFIWSSVSSSWTTGEAGVIEKPWQIEWSIKRQVIRRERPNSTVDIYLSCVNENSPIFIELPMMALMKLPSKIY